MNWDPEPEKKSTITWRQLRGMLEPAEFKEFYEWMKNKEGPKGERIYAYDFQQWIDWKHHGGSEPVLD